MPPSKLGAASRRVHRCPQLPDGYVQTDDNGARDDVVADVELFDVGNGRDGADIARRETMTGMHRESKRSAQRRTVAQGSERGWILPVVCIPARVQLHRVGTNLARQGNTLSIGIDEEAAANAGAAQPLEGPAKARRVGGQVESSFGGHFLAAFRNERHLMGTQALRKGDHLVGAGDLEVEHRGDRRGDRVDIGVLHVSPVFAQVRGDTVGAGAFAGAHGIDWYGFVTAPCLTNRRDVVDVDVQSLRNRRHVSRVTGRVAGKRRDSSGLHQSLRRYRVRKLLLIGLLFGGACQTRTIEVPAPGPVSAPTAAGPRPALDAFLSAIRAQDLQALAVAWGDKNGPVRDSKVFAREEMEQRELILIRCFKHDRARVISEAPAPDGQRDFQVELVRGTVTRVTDFFTVKGPDRWYVRSGNMDAVKDLCSTK